jgi:hypothetical protein
MVILVPIVDWDSINGDLSHLFENALKNLGKLWGFLHEGGNWKSLKIFRRHLICVAGFLHVSLEFLLSSYRLAAKL